MVFHLLSSRCAGAGAVPVPPTRLSRIAVVVAASPLLVAGGPAQAFVEISALAIAIVLLAMAWPVIQLVLLAVIVWLVRRRPGRRILLYSLIALSVAGTSLFAVVAGPDLLRSLASYRAERYWQRVAEAAQPMRLAELDQRWAERGPQGPQDHLVHLVQRPHEPLPDDVVLAHLFQRCADLFLHRGLGEDKLLDKAVEQGQVRLIRQAMAVPPCAGAAHPDRERELSERFLPLVSEAAGDFSQRIRFGEGAVDEALHQARVEALLVLLAHHPRLIDVELPDDQCVSFSQSGLRCNALSEAFIHGHPQLTLALLRSDTRAAVHLPAVALQLLEGRVQAAVEAARQQPVAWTQALPALVAIAPQEALLAWLDAVPWDPVAVLKAAPLASRDGNAVALFEAAAFREREAADWPVLWLLLGRLGPHLGHHEAEQLQAYVSGESLDDPRRQRLLLALKGARLPCRVVRTVVRHHEPVQRGEAFERLTGCEFKDAD